ncbi:BRCT domain-containing protein [Moheibacter stercoris]|uniref:BRCT domain-containing protein n=1 Tax=Moheibacter stercoris TaxID=1628251 RepID=A0ABV2LSS0_9FLAO
MSNFEDINLKVLTTKSRADKAINSLKGILLGMSADNIVNEEEINELKLWAKEHHELVNRNPFREFMLLIENAISQEIPLNETVDDLYWLCQKYEQDSMYYNATTTDLQTLQGIFHGILADGQLNDQEIFDLHNWLSQNEHLNSYYPYDEIRSLVLSIVSDKKIEEEERLILKAFLNQFVDIKDEDIKQNIEKEIVDVNISGICAVDPEITFEDKTFCITGILSRGSRSGLQKAIQEKGGIAVNTISRKTDYLIIGDNNNACWAYSCYGRKVEKALDLRKSGHQIILVHEYDVFDALENNK